SIQLQSNLNSTNLTYMIVESTPGYSGRDVLSAAGGEAAVILACRYVRHSYTFIT
ncbi:unnamed protein product, partial [Choristocarpus tenellus]